MENSHALATRGSFVGKEEIADWRLYRMDWMRRPGMSGSIDVPMNDNLRRAMSGSNTSSYNWDSGKSLTAEVTVDHTDDLCREGEVAVVVAEKASSK